MIKKPSGVKDTNNIESTKILINELKNNNNSIEKVLKDLLKGVRKQQRMNIPNVKNYVTMIKNNKKIMEKLQEALRKMEN
jgi:dihydroorotate dehydrogenase